MAKNRGLNLTSVQKRELLILSGGRCEFEGCGKLLTLDGIPISQYAHIIASSPNGPRGGELSHELANDLDNIMLLCSEHHTLIDRKIDDFPTDKLKEMKHKHEGYIRRLGEQLKASPITPLVITSPIDRRSTLITDKQVIEATGQKYLPERPCPIQIQINTTETYNTASYWQEICKKIDYFFNIICSQLIENKNNLAIFSLAPIPVIAKFGELLGDKIPLEVYQKHRIPNNWKWQSDDQTVCFNLSTQLGDKSGSYIALVLAVSSDISNERIDQSLGHKPLAYIKIQASNLSTNCIQSKKDLQAFDFLYQEALNLIGNQYSSLPVYVFPAVPVSVAFSIGCRRVSSHPCLTIFNADSQSFKKSLTIGSVL